MFDLTAGNKMIQTMDRGLSLASHRQALIASNLANLDTPGYRTRDFSFEEAMKTATARQTSPTTMTTTHPMHLQGSSNLFHPSATTPVSTGIERNDGNDVNLDRENMLLARTQSSYQAASAFMQTELRKLYALIRDGSK